MALSTGITVAYLLYSVLLPTLHSFFDKELAFVLQYLLLAHLRVLFICTDMIFAVGDAEVRP